ncbi:TIR domain-containing protein [Dactylosporangium sucinum]|uniref:TIR domain-containing protein n=1 Tax=Dactylosporangium sucinum TaxID=1424081 RepID=UPI00167C4E2E|nr:TIR domain-containing protein [Dactylosporangium sucinum]
MGDGTGRKYAAFISYNREADAAVAAALQQGLQRFARPWNRLRALRIFRDDTGLSANTGLWASIVAALGDAEYFILLASPEAAVSPWVDREVEHWLATRSAETVLVAVTDGEIAWQDGTFDAAQTTCIPTALYGSLAEEPRWVDLRGLRGVPDLTLSVPTLRSAVADIAATLHHRDKDDLVGEDIRQFRRSRRLARSAIGALIALTLVATGAGIVATRQSAIAEQRRQDAVRAADLATYRQLVAQADATRTGDPILAAQLGLAAAAISDGERARASLTATLVGSRMQAAAATQTGIIRRITSSHDGKLLAVGADRGVTLWDASNPHRLTLVAGPLEDIYELNAVAFSPDDTVLAVAEGGSGKVTLWDLADRHAPAALGTPFVVGGRIDDLPVSIAPDAHSFLFAADTFGLAIVDISDRSHPRIAPVPLAPGRAYADIALSLDRSTLAAAWHDNGINHIELWDLRQPGRPRPTGTLTVDGDPDAAFQGVSSLAVSPSGNRLAATFNDAIGGAYLWDVSLPAQPVLLAKVGGESANHHAVAFSPDGHSLALALEDYRIAVYDLPDGSAPVMAHELVGQHDTAMALGFSRDGATLISGDTGSLVIAWDLATASWVRPLGEPFDTNGRGAKAVVYARRPDGVTVVIQTGVGGAVITKVTEDGEPDDKTWLQTGESGHGVPTVAAADGITLAASVGARTIQLWDVSGAPRKVGVITLPGSAELVETAMSGNGSLLATLDDDDQVRLWDLRDRATPRDMGTVADARYIDQMTFTPDGRYLLIDASGMGRRPLILVDTGRGSTPRVVHKAFGPPDIAYGTAISPDGRTVAVSTLGGILLWDITDNGAVHQLPVRLKAGAGHATTLAFSADGRTLVTASTDQPIQVWDFADREAPTLVADPGYGQAVAVAFGPGARFTATEPDGRVRIWSADALASARNNLRARACAIALGGLPEARWRELVAGRAYTATCP